MVFKWCEVEEQQARIVEAQPQKRRAVIRVESEKTHDYVMERRSCGYPSQEEVEEIGFVPSAVSKPLWALHLSDNECREQAHTINLCNQSYKKGEFSKANSQ